MPRIYTYEIKDITIIKAFLTKYKPYHAKRSESGLPSGYICGKWYVGIANSSQGGDNNITLLCSEAFYNNFNDNVKTVSIVVIADIPVTKKTQYYICSCTGNHFWGRTITHQSDIIAPVGNQLACFNLIKDHYTKNKITVCWIDGKSNVGKSTVARYMAQQLDGVLCTSYKPWMNNHSIAGVIAGLSLNSTMPLIILLDEVDKFLNEIIEDKRVVIDTRSCEWSGNKPSWNRYWDDLHSPQNQYVIIILTSNTPCSYYDKIDTSLLRQGRIDLRINMSEQLTHVHEQFDFAL